MKQILALVDFSDYSDAVVGQAEALAKAFEGNVTLLHVAAPDPDFVGYAAGPTTVREDRAREIRGEHRELQTLAEGLRKRAISARALLIQGPTVEQILAEGQRLEAEAIVIGSHGHGALHRALLGSVSEGVVRGAHCPVLVVPAAAHASGA